MAARRWQTWRCANRNHGSSAPRRALRRSEHPLDRMRPGRQILGQQGVAPLGDVENDRARFEQSEVSVLDRRNLAEGPGTLSTSRRDGNSTQLWTPDVWNVGTVAHNRTNGHLAGAPLVTLFLPALTVNQHGRISSTPTVGTDVTLFSAACNRPFISVRYIAARLGTLRVCPVEKERDGVERQEIRGVQG